jgi:hypothetical protein
VAISPDGRTVSTGRGGVLDAEGKPARGGDSRLGTAPELTIPSLDPAYYLSISGLDGNMSPNLPRESTTVPVTASVHAPGDGTRLLTVRELDEMGGAGINESSIQDDFTVAKRFHLVPAAYLLITIPFTNDRIVLLGSTSRRPSINSGATTSSSRPPRTCTPRLTRLSTIRSKLVPKRVASNLP